MSAHGSDSPATRTKRRSWSVESSQPQAAVEGYWAQGMGGGTMLLLAGGIHYATRRRIDRREATAMFDPVASA